MSTEKREGVKTGVNGPWALSLTAFVEDGDRCRRFCGCRLGICSVGKSILYIVICEDWKQWIDSLKWRESHESVTVQETSNRRLTAGHERGNFVSAPHFGTIAKSVLKSQFCAISSDFCDFTRFQPDFTNFWFFQVIQHVKHVLTRKIVRFYESKRDFNNLDWDFTWWFMDIYIPINHTKLYRETMIELGKYCNTYFSDNHLR
jgi:hypothetical protein